MSSDSPAFAILFILGFAAIALWVWTIVDVVKVPDDSMFRAGASLVWVLVIVITGLIGAIIYLGGRKARARQPRRRPVTSSGSTAFPGRSRLNVARVV